MTYFPHKTYFMRSLPCGWILLAGLWTSKRSLALYVSSSFSHPSY